MTIKSADEMKLDIRRRKERNNAAWNDILAEIAQAFPDLSPRRHREIAVFAFSFRTKLYEIMREESPDGMASG